MYIPLNTNDKEKIEKTKAAEDQGNKNPFDGLDPDVKEITEDDFFRKKISYLEKSLEAEVQLNQVLWGRLMDKESEIISLKTALSVKS